MLPLWVGDGGLEQSVDGEGGDLSAGDHLRVDRHLAVCPSCRRQQLAMGRALRVSIAARAESPVDLAGPSLWPVLEQRIDGQNGSVPAGRYRPAFGLPDRLSDFFGAVDRVRMGVGSFVVHAAVASLLVSVVMGTIARRHRMDAQATIQGNTAPLAGGLAPAANDDMSTKLADLDDDDESTGDQLADVDPAAVADSSTAVVGNLSAKPAVPGRFGHDLDHGTGGQGDSRENKPIY